MVNLASSHYASQPPSVRYAAPQMRPSSPQGLGRRNITWVRNPTPHTHGRVRRAARRALSRPTTQAQSAFYKQLDLVKNNGRITGLNAYYIKKNFSHDRRRFSIFIDHALKCGHLNKEQALNIIRDYDLAHGVRSGFYHEIDQMAKRGELHPDSAYHVVRDFDVSAGNFAEYSRRIHGMSRYIQPQQINTILTHAQRALSFPSRVIRPIQFNPQTWSDRHHTATRQGQRDLRVGVYHETQRAWDQGFVAHGRYCRLNSEKRAITQKESRSISIDQVPMAHGARTYPKARAPFVDQRGATTVARDMVSLGLNPLVMNMANETSRGGGVERGAQAQEETLSRQSNLMEGLQNVRYPLGEVEGAFTPKVQFFRRDGDYAFEYPVTADVMGIAAYDLSGGANVPRPGTREYIAGMKQKIRLFLRTAIANGNDSVVLGALGCGAFGNNPVVVSQLYKDVLDEPEFHQKFKEIRFAIIPDHNDRNGNANAFRGSFQ